MPWPSKLMVRSAWCWFLVGLGMGVVLMIQKIWPISNRLWMLRATHVHVLLFGFATQWIMGIAYWIYPRRGRKFNMDHRGAFVCWGLVNMGILLRATAGPSFEADYWRAVTGPVLFIGAMCQVLAGVLFVSLIWNRIHSPPSVPSCGGVAGK